MIRFITAWFIALGLQACSVQQAPVHEVSAQLSSSSVSEQQLVDNLNARYQSTVAQCANGMPAYYCSGVILRTSTYNASYDFWTHSDAAERLGSVTFSFIRRDVGSNGTGLGSGFIFSDQETALAQNKAPVVRCIYPFMAGTQGEGRPNFGCGFAATKSASQDADLSTCATLATPAITAALWLENFRRFGSNVRNQCSLSTLAANQFKASLEAHNGVDAAHTATRNELLIATWREDTPERLPIEAFFYNAAASDLKNAQALRHSYYLKTSQLIPIVRVNFSAAEGNMFSWRATDQMDGYAVAASLQAAYSNIVHDCGSASLPAFLCSGILLRGTHESLDYHSWNPVPGHEGVAFSYLRKDANFDHMAVGTDNGFIFYPFLSAPAGKFAVQVQCSFPIDGNTAERGSGCGQNRYFPEVSRPCQAQGITTAAQWKTHFDSLPANYPVETWVYSYVCGFDVRDEISGGSAEPFYQSLQAMHLVPAVLLHHYNELVIQAWPQNIPVQLPIQAFFYTLSSGLAGARHDQWDFFRSTGGEFMPIIYMRLPATVSGDASFSYNPADQYCQPGASSCL